MPSIRVLSHDARRLVLSAPQRPPKRKGVLAQKALDGLRQHLGNGVMWPGVDCGWCVSEQPTSVPNRPKTTREHPEVSICPMCPRRVGACQLQMRWWGGWCRVDMRASSPDHTFFGRTRPVRSGRGLLLAVRVPAGRGRLSRGRRRGIAAVAVHGALLGRCGPLEVGCRAQRSCRRRRERAAVGLRRCLPGLSPGGVDLLAQVCRHGVGWRHRYVCAVGRDEEAGGCRGVSRTQAVGFKKGAASCRRDAGRWPLDVGDPKSLRVGKNRERTGHGEGAGF